MSALNELAKQLLSFVSTYNKQHDDLVGRCFRLENLVSSEMEARKEMTRHIERLIDHKKACISDHQSTDARIEKMEKALSEEMTKTREMDDILSGVVKKVGYVSGVRSLDQKTLDNIAANPEGYEAKFSGPIRHVSRAAPMPMYANWVGVIKAAKDESWHMHIDHKASPYDIPFSVALEYLKAGRSIRRSIWVPGVSAIMYSEKVCLHADTVPDQPFQPSADEMRAGDWMVLPETQNL